MRSTRGGRYTAVRPTLADFVLKMPRGAQVIYPKDLGPILMLADIFPGARVLESGVGSGALSMTLLRAGADVTGYELREDFANRARANVAALPRRRACSTATRSRSATSTTASTSRPRPHRARPARAVAGRATHAEGALRPAGSSWPTSRPSPRRRSCATRSTTAASPWPRPSRCCSAPGTSRASRSGPTTGWWPTPAS